jgi:hypothetical protein
MGSNLDEVIGILFSPNPSIRIMALELTRPVSEMSTKNIPEGKRDRGVRLTNSPPSVC